MNPFIASLLGGLVDAAGTLVGRVLLSLGISFSVYKGLDTSLDFLRDSAVSNFQGLPAVSLQLLGLMKVGKVISIVTSALAARMALNGMTSGAIKKMVTK